MSKWIANFQMKRSKIKVTGRQKRPQQAGIKWNFQTARSNWKDGRIPCRCRHLCFLYTNTVRFSWPYLGRYRVTLCHTQWPLASDVASRQRLPVLPVPVPVPARRTAPPTQHTRPLVLLRSWSDGLDSGTLSLSVILREPADDVHTFRQLFKTYHFSDH